MVGKRYLGLVFANTVLYKSTILLIFEAEFKESVGQALVSRVYYNAHRGWNRRKIFIIKVLGCLENAVLRLVFANSIFQKGHFIPGGNFRAECRFSDDVVTISLRIV